jgi:hypothetical protein
MAFRSTWSPGFDCLLRASSVVAGNIANNTLACWARFDDLSDSYEVVEVNGSGSFLAVIQYYTGVSGLIFQQRNADGSVIAECGATGAITATANTWYHLAMTWDGTTLRAYVNGVEVETDTGTPGTRGPWTNLQVGPSLGYLQDALFYNAALSAGEIAALYAARVPKRTSGLLVWLPCFPGSNRLVDYSGLGNNFSNNGTPADPSATTPLPPIPWGMGSAELILLPAASSISISAAGVTKTTGAASMQIERQITAAGTTKTTGAATFSKDVAAAGVTKTTGAASMQIERQIQPAAGVTKTTGAASIGITYALTASGVTRTFGSAAVSGNSPTGTPTAVHLWRRNRRGR